jgi:hypothetical protein
MGEDWAWIGFISGIIGIVSFIIVSFKFLSGPKESIVILTSSINGLIETLNRDSISRDKQLEEIAEIVEKAEEYCKHIKHQLGHPENFNFGSDKTNIKIEELSKELYKLNLMVENFIRNS